MKNIDQVGPTVVKPPAGTSAGGRKSVFLAGTIDDGRSVDWQSEITRMIDADVTVFNPRRDSWDANAGAPEVERQITWEMDAMDAADMIVFYFAPGSKSPVTMLELGRYAGTGKCVVCCPEGFWRKVNVDVFCKRAGVETVADLADLAERINRM